jgi:hypothetical protein
MVAETGAVEGVVAEVAAAEAAGEVVEGVVAEAGVVMEGVAAEIVVAPEAAGMGEWEAGEVDKTGAVVVALDMAAVANLAVVAEGEATAGWMSAAAGRAVKAATVVMVG